MAKKENVIIRFFSQNQMKIAFLMIEILAIIYIGYLFLINRFDKQIISIALNVIFVGIAFTLLSYLLSPPEIKYNLSRVISIITAIFFITLLSFILAFFVNLENKKNSDDFYIYFIYDKNKNILVNMEKDNNHNWLRFSSYFNSFSEDKSIKPDVDFFKDFLDFLIIRNFGLRYSGSWFIHFDNMPLTGVSTWGPKDYKLPIKSKDIKQENIFGYNQNSLLNKIKVSQIDEVIKVPEKTIICLERGIKTDLLPNMDMDEAMKKRTRRITIKNNYCNISLDIYFLGLLTGEFLKDIKNEVVTPALDKCNIQVFAFKAKYQIEYSRLRMGIKNFISYYRPWAEDLCTSFQSTFDIQDKLRNIEKDDYLRIRGSYL